MKRAFLAVAVLAIFATSTNASVVTVTLSTNTKKQWTGTDTSQEVIDAWIAANLPGGANLTTLYKSDDETDQGLGFVDSGAFKDSYDTDFVPAGDAEDATITYVGGDALTGGWGQYLLVKDGDASPAWYLFDLQDIWLNYKINDTAVTDGSVYQWDGLDTIKLVDFWVGDGKDGKGAISHVSIYGPTIQPSEVPEPASLAIWSLIAAGGAAAASRRRRRVRWSEQNRLAIRSIIERS